MTSCYKFFFPILFLLGLSELTFSQTQVAKTDSTVELRRDTIQRIPWVNEAILSLSYANGGMAFGLIYKRQVAEKRYFRISAANLQFYGVDNNPIYSNQFPTRYIRASVNLTLGVEWRFKIHKMIWTYTGIDVLFGANFYANRVDNPSLPTNQRTDEDFNLKSGLAFNSGVLIDVHEMISIGLNLSPDIYYQYSPWEYDDGNGTVYKGQRHSVRTSFSSGSVQAQVIFRWKRKPYRLKKVSLKSTP